MTNFKIILFTLATLLLGSGCSAANLSQWLPAAADSPTATPPPRYAIGPDTTTQGLDNLSYYRRQTVIEFDGVRNGQPSAGQLAVEQQIDRPAAGHYRRQQLTAAAALPNSNSTLTLYQTPQQVYVRRGNEQMWFTLTPGQVISPTDFGFLEPEPWLVIPPAVTTPPTFETLDGRSTQRFRFTQADLNSNVLEFEQAQGNVWLDTASHLIVQYTLTATVRAVTPLQQGRLLDAGDLTISYSLTPFTEPPDAVVPPQAGQIITGPLQTLPRLPDATLTAIYPTLLEYTSAITPISATLFYQEQLLAQNWDLLQTDAYDNKSSLQFSRDAQDLSILITPTQNATAIKVTLALRQP